MNSMRYLEFEKPLREIESKIEQLEVYASSRDIDLSSEIKPLKDKLNNLLEEIYSHLTPWQQVQLARHPDRPYCLDYIRMIADDFMELHGDRAYRDDEAIVAGFCSIGGRSVAIVGHQKGRDTEENIRRNFGMPNPEGFRKARRIMETAARMRMPIVTLIDSPGAFPGIGAEERGQHLVIAENLEIMSQLNVPIICVVIGEGGSGGALAIGVGNRVLMLENGYYAVCTPEACAAIILRDRTMASSVAGTMRIVAQDLKNLDLVDEIISEPLGGAHRNPEATAVKVKEAILRHLSELEALDGQAIVEDRYNRFRRMGVLYEAQMPGLSPVN
ncbi:MAG: acetyl-CoA carboxylase carboxyltransferase subunit alpha [Candidatus Omnitrophica bacterium]|nr:acetyl-CoA carboxylase carboxyltransferase subunit alpha [Candidatus Omnitrophota bacterium]